MDEKEKSVNEKDMIVNEDDMIIEGLVFYENDEKLEENKGEKKKRRTLLFVECVIFTIVLVMTAAILVMRETGKSKLYEANEKASINFVRNDEELPELDIEIDMDNMGELVQGESGSEVASSAEQQSSSEIQSSEENVNIDLNDGNSNEYVANSAPQNVPEGIDVEISEESTTSAIIQADEGEDYDVIYNGEKYVYNDDIITLLVLGIDKLDKVKPAANGIDGGQSDGIYLLVMNPHTKKIDLIAVHRDTITKIDIYDKNGDYLYSGRAQICLQHGYGDGMELSNERAKEAVSNLFYGLPIHSVSSINMGAIGQLNDAVGGVTLEALESFSFNGATFKQGETVTLKGNSAFAYVKWRDTSKHFTASKRLERQKQYLNLFVAQALGQVKKDVGVISDVYGIVKDYVVTDLSLDEMTYLGTEAIGYSFGKIYSLEGTVDTSRKYERYYLDEEAFQKLVIDVFYEKK